MSAAFSDGPKQTTHSFSSVSLHLPNTTNTPTNHTYTLLPHTQQWVRAVPERRGLLLHQDLLRDRGRQLGSGSFPAGSGPGRILSSQLGLLWFPSGLWAPDPAGPQAQVQLQLRSRAEQAQSAQPVGPRQLLADPLRASLSGGCSRVLAR